MSMPSFPKDGANMSREQALTLIIASIAMEERALGHIIEAEGDKLRHVLGRCACATPEEILKVNNSAARLLEAAAENQRNLRCKLAIALDGCGAQRPEPPCPPPKPPCPEQKSLMLLHMSGGCLLWRNEGLIPWSCAGERGGAIRWSKENPARVELDPGRVYSVHCTFNLREAPAGSGRIVLEGTGAPPLRFSFRCASGEAVTLQYSTLLLPGSASGVSFRLRSGIPLRVEQAELSIVEV